MCVCVCVRERERVCVFQSVEGYVRGLVQKVGQCEFVLREFCYQRQLNVMVPFFSPAYHQSHIRTKKNKKLEIFFFSKRVLLERPFLC